jgi:hypothetical protein
MRSIGRRVWCGAARWASLSRRWSAPALACGLALGALSCGKDDPVGPDRSPRVDLTPLVDLLNDPLVQILPTTLADTIFAVPLQAELAGLRKSSEDGDVPAVRRSIESTRAATKRYDDRSDIDPGNRVILAAIAHILDRADYVLELIVGPAAQSPGSTTDRES